MTQDLQELWGKKTYPKDPQETHTLHHTPPEAYSNHIVITDPHICVNTGISVSSLKKVRHIKMILHYPVDYLKEPPVSHKYTIGSNVKEPKVHTSASAAFVQVGAVVA